MTNNMPVVILCGGMGTRIRDVSENIPKPMIPIGGRPILWHIMKIYGHYGFNRFILCLGYKGEIIKEFFLNYYAMVNDVTVDLSKPNGYAYHDTKDIENWEVTLVDTGANTMTGARIARIKRFLDNDENFMLTYGDGLADIDISKLLLFHESHDKLVTITGVHPASRFGEMVVESDGKISSFAEKPQVSEGRINGGFFVMRTAFIDRYLSEDPHLILEQYPLTQCTKDNQLMAFNHDGYWQPMDTSREYEAINSLWDKGKAPWKVW
ncbi:glucose-1-phosphate cytidylyltransferase [hydrocarbon metagenome]|uniref:Glucose-1-phosphate cytidylyltransferase n=1 Tax=hydrocarbon metagenome TaxID=938273 RepID=A0A0W8FTD2_9ZZZZ